MKLPLDTTTTAIIAMIAIAIVAVVGIFNVNYNSYQRGYDAAYPPEERAAHDRDMVRFDSTIESLIRIKLDSLRKEGTIP